jgi:hypothetical protein
MSTSSRPPALGGQTDLGRHVDQITINGLSRVGLRRERLVANVLACGRGAA